MGLKEDKDLLNTIMDLGAALLQNGAETHKTEKNLYRVCRGYGFTHCNIWVVPSNIQASVTTPDGEDITMIRHIRYCASDYTKLADLNDLARTIARAPVGAPELKARFDAIMAYVPQPAWVFYLAGVLGGAGFSVFFGGNLPDAAVAACASFIVAFFGRRLGSFEKNPMVFNFALSFVAEIFIILAVHFGFGQHIGYITIGVVMLLISGIGLTNGIKDLMHLDTLSGTIKVTESLLGAVGIAIGMGFPLFLLRGWGSSEMTGLNPSVALGLVSCTVGCIGFALWFNAKPKHVSYCALGATLVWGVYLIANAVYPDLFVDCLAAAVVCAAYAQVASRLAKAPSTIFNSVSIFPLVPGAALYYTLYGVVTSDPDLTREKGWALLTTCFALVLGMMVVEVVVRVSRRFRGMNTD